MTLTSVRQHITTTSVRRLVVYVSAAREYQPLLQQKNPPLNQPPDLEMTDHRRQPQP
mgnify:CR=1 FL=1